VAEKMAFNLCGIFSIADGMLERHYRYIWGGSFCVCAGWGSFGHPKKIGQKINWHSYSGSIKVTLVV